MSFSTIARVRSESGFAGDTDISDTYIGGYLTQAHGVLLGYVANIYDATKFTGSLFIGSQAESMLQRIEELFASWYLLIAEYGPEGRNTDKDGYTKVKEAERLCIAMVEGTLTLFDVNSNEFTKKPSATAGSIVMSAPDNNTNLTPIFSTSQVF